MSENSPAPHFRRPRRSARALGIAALAFGGSLLPVNARAIDGDATTAQALFDQAKKLMAQGAYAEACPKLEESQRLDAGSGTLLNLGDCYEHQGKTASAWSKFVEAAEAARAAGKGERERVARERASTLLPRLAKVVIVVKGNEMTVGLEVKRDGASVERSQWGVPVPVDPGQHTVTASAPARVSWETKVFVQAAGQVVMVPVPALAPAPPALAPAPPVTPAVARSSAPVSPANAESSARADLRAQPVTMDRDPKIADREARPDAPGLGTQRILALVSGGFGLGGLAMGTGFGLVSKAKRDEATAYCDGSVCREQAGVDLKREAIAAGNVATLGFLLGAAGVVGGAVLWLSAPSPSSGAAIQVGVDTRGIAVRGAW